MKKIIALCLSVILVFGLTSCGGPSSEDVVNSFLKSMQKGNTAGDTYEDKEFKLDTYCIGFDIEENKDKITKSELEFLETFSDKIKDFSFKILDEERKGNKSEVTVEIETYNFGEEMNSMMDEYTAEAFEMLAYNPSDEEINKLLHELSVKYLNKTEKSYKEKVVISLNKKEGEWVIEKFEDDSDVLNALLGGMIKSIESYEKKMGM